MNIKEKNRVGIITDVYNKKKKGGISWYTGRLVEAIKEFSLQDMEIVLIHAEKNDDEVHSGFKKIIYPSIKIKESIYLPKVRSCKKIFKDNNIKVLHFPSFRLVNWPFFKIEDIKFILTIHDLARCISKLRKPIIISKNLRQIFYNFYHFLEDKTLNSVKNRVDRFIAVSYNTKKDMIKLLGIPEHKINVVYEAADKIFKIECCSEKTPDWLNRFCPYILTPSLSLMVIEVYHQLLKKGIKHKLLVFNKPAFLPLLKDKGLEEEIIFLEYVSLNQLAELYRWADLLIYYNKYEGFGLIPIEAMASGCPVISSCVGSLPEIIGNGGILLNNNEKEEWIKRAYEILISRLVREKLIATGLIQSQRFSWGKTAEETLRIYREMLTKN